VVGSMVKNGGDKLEDRKIALAVSASI